MILIMVVCSRLLRYLYFDYVII